MKEYKRNCSVCNKELKYNSYSAYYLAEKNKSICKSCASRRRAKRMCDLSPLLEETSEAYYWVGFLLADGHFEKGRLRFYLGIKDKEQVIKFCNFIKWSGNLEENNNISIGISPMHTEIVEELCKKFDIKNRKTYNPPETILNHDKELLKYLLIGFIDGDGNIEHQYKRKDCFIRIKVHKSWENILKEFCQLIGYDTKHVRINKQGYCELYISDSTVVTALKKEVKNVPALERKWGKIDETFISRYQASKILHEKIIKMLNNGMRNIDITNQLGVSSSLISKIKKQLWQKNLI